MIKELVLHLGDTKTGSTSIQNALVRGLCQIPGKTLIYPTTNNHVAMARTLTQERRFSQRAARFKRLRSAFEKSDADIGIVSAEHFQFVDPDVLVEAIETYWPAFRDRLRLVAYVRPHADKLVSTFSERVKLGSRLPSLEAFFETANAIDTFNYSQRFGAWRRVFGERFILRPFVRSELHQGDAICDFVKILAGDDNFRITGKVAANTSLSVAQLALLREVHEVINDKIGTGIGPRYLEARGAVGRLVGEYMRQHQLGQDSPKLAIPKPMAEAVRARYAPDAEALDAAFFANTPMSDALNALDRKLVDAPQSLKASDHFAPEVIEATRIQAHVLADLVALDPQGIRSTIGKARASEAEADGTKGKKTA